MHKTKPPGAVLEYGWDWSDVLAREGSGGDVVSASVWEVEPAGELTLSDESFSDTVTLVWVAGGELGKTYRLTNRMTTNSVPPRTYERTILLTVGERSD